MHQRNVESTFHEPRPPKIHPVASQDTCPDRDPRGHEAKMERGAAGRETLVDDERALTAIVLGEVDIAFPSGQELEASAPEQSPLRSESEADRLVEVSAPEILTVTRPEPTVLEVTSGTCGLKAETEAAEDQAPLSLVLRIGGCRVEGQEQEQGCGNGPRDTHTHQRGGRIETGDGQTTMVAARE